jgi:hypothetical protein
MEEIYIDLGNGGFNITIDRIDISNVSIPVFKITSGVHGHKMSDIEIRMTPERIIRLGEFLIDEGEKSKSFYKDDNLTQLGVDADKINPWAGAANSKFTIRTKDSISEDEKINKIECPVCHSNSFKDNSTYENNGIFGPGWREWLVSESKVCLTCGVVFKTEIFK